MSFPESRPVSDASDPTDEVRQAAIGELLLEARASFEGILASRVPGRFDRYVANTQWQGWEIYANDSEFRPNIYDGRANIVTRMYIARAVCGELVTYRAATARTLAKRGSGSPYLCEEYCLDCSPWTVPILTAQTRFCPSLNPDIPRGPIVESLGSSARSTPGELDDVNALVDYVVQFRETDEEEALPELLRLLALSKQHD